MGSEEPPRAEAAPRVPVGPAAPPGAEVGSRTVPGVGPITMMGPVVGVAPDDAPGAELGVGVDKDCSAGVCYILAESGTVSLSSSLSLSKECCGNEGGGVRNTPSASSCAKLHNRR